MTPHQNFLRFRTLLTQACFAFNSNEPISWDLSDSRRSPAYIRMQLRKVMNEYILTPAWHEEILPPSTIKSILNDWSFRDVPPRNVEIGPRKTKPGDLAHAAVTSHLTELTLPLANAKPDLRLTIDGTNADFISAIALLKNHDQISQPVLLKNFDTSHIERLYATFPNIELIPDTIAGMPTPDYILV